MHRSVTHALVCAVLLAIGGNASADVRALDDAGREVRLRAPASRIVSLSPHATELLFAVGAGDAVVAVTEYSDHPEAARRLPRVGGLGRIDLEALAAARPELVVAWRSGTPEQELATIERLGIAVFRSEPRAIEDIATSLERLGTLAGRGAEGRRAAAGFRARIDALRIDYAHRMPVRVFYQVWASPLMTVGGGHVISTVIELCGGRNVFASLPGLAPTIDAEAVVERDPQLIVTAQGASSRADDEARWARWRGVDAVERRRYLFVDPDLVTRSTPRIADGAKLLCEAIDAARQDLSRGTRPIR